MVEMLSSLSVMFSPQNNNYLDVNKFITFQREVLS